VAFKSKMAAVSHRQKQEISYVGHQMR